MYIYRYIYIYTDVYIRWLFVVRKYFIEINTENSQSSTLRRRTKAICAVNSAKEDEAEADGPDGPDGPDDAWDSEPRAKHQKTASRG